MVNIAQPTRIQVEGIESRSRPIKPIKEINSFFELLITWGAGSPMYGNARMDVSAFLMPDDRLKKVISLMCHQVCLAVRMHGYSPDKYPITILDADPFIKSYFSSHGAKLDDPIPLYAQLRDDALLYESVGTYGYIPSRFLGGASSFTQWGDVTSSTIYLAICIAEAIHRWPSDRYMPYLTMIRELNYLGVYAFDLKNAGIIHSLDRLREELLVGNNGFSMRSSNLLIKSVQVHEGAKNPPSWSNGYPDLTFYQIKRYKEIVLGTGLASRTSQADAWRDIIKAVDNVVDWQSRIRVMRNMLSLSRNEWLLDLIAPGSTYIYAYPKVEVFTESMLSEYGVNSFDELISSLDLQDDLSGITKIDYQALRALF